MPKERRIQEKDRIPPRADADARAVAEGDAQLESEPPNVAGTGPPEAERNRGADADVSSDASPAMGDGAVGDELISRGAARASPHEVRTDSGAVPAHEELVPTDLEPEDGELIALQREFSSLSDRHLRLAAEFDNYRRRSERERMELWARAQADLAARLLDALDDLERATAHADSASADALLHGMQLVERKLRQALQAAGLETVHAEGARFDPNSMEAVAMAPADAAEEDDTVADVFQRGYRFKGALLRPARVRVKKHGA